MHSVTIKIEKKRTKPLTITITGEPSSGKSTLRMFIVDILRENGMDVVVKPTIDHPTEGDARKFYSRSKFDMVKSVMGEVTIDEVYANRNAQEDIR